MSVIRITVTVSEELGTEIQELAVKEKRKPASMAAILLEQAIKERNRKKKTVSSGSDSKEGNTEPYAPKSLPGH